MRSSLHELDASINRDSYGSVSSPNGAVYISGSYVKLLLLSEHALIHQSGERLKTGYSSLNRFMYGDTSTIDVLYVLLLLLITRLLCDNSPDVRNSPRVSITMPL